MPRKAATCCLQVSDWSAADRRVWQDSHRPGGLFDSSSPAAQWAGASRRKTASGYGRWLHWLQQSGQYDPDAAAGQRVTPARVLAYLRDLENNCAPMTRLCRLQELRDAMRVMAPATDCSWLTDFYQTLRARSASSRNKRQRIKPVGELADLGIAMMAAAEHERDWSARRRAVHYRDGLMITLLAYRPLRLQNLAAIRLGTHLVDLHGRHWICFQEAETKAHRPYEAAVPHKLEHYLKTYLAAHRPILLAGEQGILVPSTDALWVSEIGTALQAGPLATRIRKHTKAAFGRSITPHLFRDVAATTIATDNPVHVRDSHLILGHARLHTTEQHYNQAHSLQAAQRWQNALHKLQPHSITAKELTP